MTKFLSGLSFMANYKMLSLKELLTTIEEMKRSISVFMLLPEVQNKKCCLCLFHFRPKSARYADL